MLIAGGGDVTKAAFEALVKSQAKPVDLTPLTKGGPSRWNEVVETQGVIGTPAAETDSYVIDKLTIPYENPYNSWMRTAAFDFFPDGTRAALTTWSGDVWIVSGIDEGLEHLTWKRFATGLHQPLGLKIVDNTIYTVGHDQITRLHRPGRRRRGRLLRGLQQRLAAHQPRSTPSASICRPTRPATSSSTSAPPSTPAAAASRRSAHDHGCILKVSKDGQYMEHIATGLRAPNGMCVGPNGEVTTGDNEGSWVPLSPLHWVKQGQFLGVVTSAHRPMKSPIQARPRGEPKPLMWLSHNGGVDNSCGGQVWVTSDKWGPFKGDLLFMSPTASRRLFKVMYEEVNGQMQGGAVAVPAEVHQQRHARALQPRRRPALRLRPERLADQRRQGRRLRPRPLHRQAGAFAVGIQSDVKGHLHHLHIQA